MSKQLFHCFLNCSLVVLLACSSRASAQDRTGERAFPGQVTAPSSSDRLAGLAVRNEEASQELFKLADEKFRFLAKEIPDFESQMAQRGAAKLNVKELSRLSDDFIDLLWAGKHLAALGESAGGDYIERHADLLKRYHDILREVKKTPPTSEVTRTSAPLTKVAQQNAKRLKTAISLANKGELEKSDLAYQELTKALHLVGVWWFDKNNERSAAFRAFYDFGTQINAAMLNELSRVSNERINEAVAARRPDFNGTIKQLNDAAGTIRGGQQPQFEGQPSSGPELVGRLTQQWRQIQLNAFYCQGLELCRKNSGAASDGGYGEVTNEQAVFQRAFGKGVADVIIATAESATAESVPELYNAYLAAVSEVLPLCREASFQNSVEMGLDQLLAKAPEFQNEIQAYRNATDDVLRWRQRVATAYGKARSDGYDSLTTVFMSSQGQGIDQNSLLIQRDKSNGAYLDGSAIDATQPLVDFMLGRKARFTGVIGPRGELDYCTSAVLADVYGRFPLNFQYGSEIEALAATLLVSNTHAPLSLSVAGALHAAMSGDFEQVGGRVLEVGIEGAIPRLTLLSENDWGMVGIDTTAELQQYLTDRQLSTRLDRVFVRCMVEPDWLQSRHFFVALTPQETPPADTTEAGSE